MGSAIAAIRCANCDRELQEHEQLCPSCGGQNRIYEVLVDPAGRTALARRIRGMGSAITAIRCANCDRELEEHEQLCPSCGGQNRIYEVLVDPTGVTVLASLRGNIRDQKGFKRVEFKSGSKISRETRRRAEEYLQIDRRDPRITKKYHRVEEANEDGQMVTVHEHEETFPAKRRPLKSRSENEE